MDGFDERPLHYAANNRGVRFGRLVPFGRWKKPGAAASLVAAPRRLTGDPESLSLIEKGLV